ncbi:uncharacterized protein LOC131160803 [Malania oleifera]|uniref:uncharacterized protein LOC131160803 n=1 Tax=Malania oleifera TaxID=397392 RepID=UPI0025AE8A55|nr:uncharacterized protein LOC131160803 [Malania oleifera]
MYNSEHKSGLCTPMSPRISFSNDFVEVHHDRICSRSDPPPSLSSPSPPSSSDFEFSVSNYSMMSADELFFKGQLLPFKDNPQFQKTTTLREELLVDEDEDSDKVVSLRPPKGGSASTAKWKGLLGLRKHHIGSKKSDQKAGAPDEVKNATTSIQELLMSRDEESSCRDIGMEI